MTTPSYAFTGSTGSRSADGQQMERVFALHRLLFQEKRGKRVPELVKARKEWGQKLDMEMTKEHHGRLKELNDRMDMKLKNCLEYGSTSIWTQKERDRIEEARQDPEEAKAFMTKKLRDQAKSYSDQRTSMMKKVNSMPALNIDEKRWAKIEEERRDPQEAVDAMKKFMKAQDKAYNERNTAMQRRVASLAPLNIRPKAEWAKIEELRQDPEEAKAAMEEYMKAQAKSYMEQCWLMDDRVAKMENCSRWTKQQWNDIEEARQDPDEARETMTKHLKVLADTFSDKKKAMEKRVKARPDMSRWTKKEWEAIEEARQDPAEALAAAKKKMQEQSKAFLEQRKEMEENLKAETQTWAGWPKKEKKGRSTSDQSF